MFRFPISLPAVAADIPAALQGALWMLLSAAADASAVKPYDYARLPFVALIGFFVFGETSDALTWIGAGVIAAASVYLAHHESKTGS